MSAATAEAPSSASPEAALSARKRLQGELPVAYEPENPSRDAIARSRIRPRGVPVNPAALPNHAIAGLEERIPWMGVKKAWGLRRNEWVATVQSTLDVLTLSRQLLFLESMLKNDALNSTWSHSKLAWRGKLAMCTEAGVLEKSVGELDAAIQWARILVAPDGRPLTEAEIASGAYGVGGAPSVPVPAPLASSSEPPEEPPAGVPRSVSRILMLLQSMGVRRFEPRVAVQLLDMLYIWTASVLQDAASNARLRIIGTTRNPQLRQQLATQNEPLIESADVRPAMLADALRPPAARAAPCRLSPPSPATAHSYAHRAAVARALSG